MSTSGWKNTKWGELATLEYGKAIRGYQEVEGYYPVFGTNGQIGWWTEPLYSHAGVIIGRKGVYRGVHYSNIPFFVIDTAFYLKPKADFDIKWAYYQLLDFDINNLDSGTAIPSTSREAFYEISVKLPPLPTQRRIAAVLSAYDDLIENNTQRIKALEAAAQALYREWFVEFRFPGHESVEWVESALGRIPQGWEWVSFPEAVEINPRHRLPKDTTKYYVSMEGLSADSMLVTSSEMRTGNSGSKFQNYDTLMARITPSLENGKIGFVQFMPDDDDVAIGSTEFIVLRSKTLTPEFVYFLARSPQVREPAIRSMVGASGRQRVQMACFDAIYVPQPNIDLLESFRRQVRPSFELIQLLAERNSVLREARDLLLPRLISGELSVEDVPLPEELDPVGR